MYLRTILISLGIAFSGPVAACELALVLAVDVSGSVDRDEYSIQMQGLANALRDPLVSEALVRARAEVSLLAWTGSDRQRLSIPWTPTRTFDQVEELARVVETTERPWRHFSTAIGEALLQALGALINGPDCKNRVIDLSGDGFSNEGIAPNLMRDRLNAAGVTVNAIAIEGEADDLTAYFWAMLYLTNHIGAGGPSRPNRSVLLNYKRQCP